jgi:hypothetical protein
MSKSNLLIDETPIVFQPSLAKLIGLHEAIVLQTLRFWCGQKKCGKVVDDERWIFNTTEQWREFSFPFWSARTIGEIFRTLESMGLVKSKQFDLKAGKAMKYYTISQSALTILTSEKADHLEDSSTSIWNILPDHLEDSSRSARARLIKQYTEKHTEELKPLTPLQGEVENSAKASSSTSSIENEFLFSSERAKAQGSKSTDFNSRPPHSGKKPIKRDSRKSPPTEIPSDLDCPAFREVWNDFLTHRKEKKKAVTPTNERALLKKLRSWGTSKAVDALQNSVTNGWLGVFPPKEEEWKPTTI